MKLSVPSWKITVSRDKYQQIFFADEHQRQKLVLSTSCSQSCSLWAIRLLEYLRWIWSLHTESCEWEFSLKNLKWKNRIKLEYSVCMYTDSIKSGATSSNMDRCCAKIIRDVSKYQLQKQKKNFAVLASNAILTKKLFEVENDQPL